MGKHLDILDISSCSISFYIIIVTLQFSTPTGPWPSVLFNRRQVFPGSQGYNFSILKAFICILMRFWWTQSLVTIRIIKEKEYEIRTDPYYLEKKLKGSLIDSC